MTHNISIPHFYAKLRNSHLYQQDDSVTGTTDVVVFGVQSIEGRALTFHILMDNGVINRFDFNETRNNPYAQKVIRAVRKFITQVM